MPMGPCRTSLGKKVASKQAKAPRCLPPAADAHHTTRVAGRHPIATSVAASQTTFPDPSVPELRPGVAMLARGEEDHFRTPWSRPPAAG